MEKESSRPPVVIAGPCSIECEEQFYAVCAALAAMPHIAAIRCGVWKPRTQPGGFEGLGEEALRIMASVRQRIEGGGRSGLSGFPGSSGVSGISGCSGFSGLSGVSGLSEGALPPYCCEVATPAHVEACLRHGINILWVGARTTGSPFMVEELVEALRGTDTTVMVKNPPSPDLRLWIGAIQRLEAAGVRSVVAIHRGFAQYGESTYRNSPLWEIPIELRRQFPELPMLCDPSHIAGQRSLVGGVAQQALDLHFDGLMLEVHNEPMRALTDAAQQLTPEELGVMLNGLTMRRSSKTVPELDGCRRQIDDIDHQLLTLLSRRMRLSGEIAAIKSRNDMAVFQPGRWDAVLRRLENEAAELGLDPEFIEGLYAKIHAESIRIQEKTIRS